MLCARNARASEDDSKHMFTLTTIIEIILKFNRFLPEICGKCRKDGENSAVRTTDISVTISTKVSPGMWINGINPNNKMDTAAHAVSDFKWNPPLNTLKNPKPAIASIVSTKCPVTNPTTPDNITTMKKLRYTPSA